MPYEDSDPVMTYSKAGVDIDAKMSAVKGAREEIRSTFTRGVLGDVGGFGGLFRPDFSGMVDPVLVASTDGAGTKTKVAIAAGIHDTVGQDLVNHCVNDILVQGARPLFFLDYIAMGKMKPAVVEGLIAGFAKACRENGCALLGGETAEMPGVYHGDDYDLAGTIVGVVDRPALLDGGRVKAGDVLLGLPSSGLHTNGYSLARMVFFEKLGMTADDPVPELGQTAGESLLAIHRSYLKVLSPLLERGLISGMAHITGGGFPDNLPRVIPAGLGAVVRPGEWEWPPLFQLLKRETGLATEDMLRVFNCGVGMVLIVSASHAGEVEDSLTGSKERVFRLGGIEGGASGVRYA